MRHLHRSAGMFISHDPVGVMHIAPSGRRTLYGRQNAIPGQFTPNGIALRPDGSLLIANAGLEGGVWQVDRSGDCRPFLMEFEARHLYLANFVLADERGRLWISVSTRQRPRSVAYDRSVSDGYIVLCDDAGARIVADGLGYANECRISNDGSHLYVNETFARRISRFAILPDATLGLGAPALEQQFFRTILNIIARNQDDHVKNIAFLMDQAGEWTLSPAFDVNYSYNPRGD